MKTILLKPLYHHGTERIGIFFERDTAIQSLLQKEVNAQWSKTHKCWHIPLIRAHYDTLMLQLKDKAQINSDELRKHLSEKNEKNSPTKKQPEPVKIPPPKSSKKVLIKHKPTLHAANEEALKLFLQQMVLKGLSENTIRTYRNEFLQFLNLIGEIPASDFTVSRLKDYLQYCHTTLGLSENTMHSKINALKFYFEQVLHREKFFWDIPRPKKPFQLPNVLGENEITRLFNSIQNLKHKAILFTTYSAGLRVSETTALKIKHVDSDRMQLLIKGAKGKKDRYVGLSPIVLDILRVYLKKCNPRPLVYVFEGMTPGKAYSHRSAQKIFQIGKEKARIGKDITFHGLRHSFATHLLEKGVDVKYIQELLGHFDIKTTMKYLHVRNDQLVTIVSPFDDLYKKGGISM